MPPSVLVLGNPVRYQQDLGEMSQEVQALGSIHASESNSVPHLDTRITIESRV